MTFINVPKIHGCGHQCHTALSDVRRRPLSRRHALRTPFLLRRGGAGMADSMRPPVYISYIFRRPPTTVYFLTVPEVQQQLTALQQAARPIRVAGPVTADPIHWEARHLSLAFRIGEGEARLPVQYKGVKPDMFQAGVTVIVEGRIGQDGVLHAATLMTSCPSKYQDEKKAQS